LTNRFPPRSPGADLCTATRTAPAGAGRDEEFVDLVIEACHAACGEEFERNAGHHEHCRVCAEVVP